MRKPSTMGLHVSHISELLPIGRPSIEGMSVFAAETSRHVFRGVPVFIPEAAKDEEHFVHLFMMQASPEQDVWPTHLVVAQFSKKALPTSEPIVSAETWAKHAEGCDF